MHQAGPPLTVQPPGAGQAPIAVRGAWRRAFDGSSEAARDPTLRRYLGDLVRPYGLELRDDLLDQGAGYSYGDMAEALFAEADVAGRQIDLVVIAHAVSDVVPGRSTAAHLSHLCRSGPLAFAVCDQGNAAPFTALRLLGSYARGAGCRRGLLVVVEQAPTLYRPQVQVPMPQRNAAVVIEFGDGAPGGLAEVRVRAGVAPAQVPGELRAEAIGLAAGPTDVTLVAGNGLSCLLAGPAGHGPDGDAPGRHGSGNGALAGLAAAELVVAAAGQPCTGVWWELAGRLAGWQATGRRVLLADYDAGLGYLCVAAMDIGTGGSAADGPPASERLIR